MSATDPALTLGAVRSMTGLAQVAGDSGVARWTWELKTVNAKGLDDRAFADARLSELEGLLGDAGSLNERVYGIVKAKVS